MTVTRTGTQDVLVLLLSFELPVSSNFSRTRNSNERELHEPRDSDGTLVYLLVIDRTTSYSPVNSLEPSVGRMWSVYLLRQNLIGRGRLNGRLKSVYSLLLSSCRDSRRF